MGFADPSTAAASAARTTTGNSGALTADRADTLHVQVDVTAVSGGTPNLLVSVEWSMDGVTFTAPDGSTDALTAFTATGSKIKTFAAKAPFYRIVWTITGTTPSFTFAIRTYSTR